MTTILPNDRDVLRATLNRKLKQAERRRVAAEKAVADLSEKLDELNELDTLEVIRSWRGKPDWEYLLVGKRSTSSYALCDFMLERLGLRVGMGIRCDTGQRELCIAIADKGDAQLNSEHISQVRQGMAAIAPHIIPADDGLVPFSIRGENIEDCAKSMLVSPSLEGPTHIVTMHFGHELHRDVYSSLGEALLYVQVNHPAGYDVFEDMSRVEDHPGYTGYYLAEAVKAYLDGCRSAGIPLPIFGADEGRADD